METFLIYLFKLAICFTVFYICIKALLSKETFFLFNRFVILVGAGICLILASVEIKVKSEDILRVHAPIIMLEKALGESSSILADSAPLTSKNSGNYIYSEPQYAEYDSTNAQGNLPVKFILFYIYIIGLLVNLIIVLRSIYSMVDVIKKGNKQNHEGYILVLISENMVPFSWGKYIVLPESDYKNHPDEIIAHEIAHAKYYHSIDIIIMELIVLFQWFNPAIWLLKRELKEIHEYQADKYVLQSGIDATKYQLLLVKKAVGASSYTLANSFNHSKIKKRITMMLKEKSNKWARLKLLLMLPLATLTVFAFARPEMNESLNSLVEYESTTILPEVKIPKKEVVKFMHPVIENDTTPKRTIKFTPPKKKKDNAKSDTAPKRIIKFIPPAVKKKDTTTSTIKIVKDDDLYLSSYKVGDRFKDLKGRTKEVVSVNPPETKLVDSVVVTKRRPTKKEVIIAEDVEGKKAARKTSPPPPPPIKKNDVKAIVKDETKKEETIIIKIVEDVEGKKAERKSSPPPPPPIKKNDVKVIVKDEPKKEEIE